MKSKLTWKFRNDEQTVKLRGIPIYYIEIFYSAPQASTIKINTAEVLEYTKIVN